MARPLNGKIFRGGDGHSKGQTSGDVRNEILVALAKPAAVDTGALGGTGHHGSHRRIAKLGNIQIFDDAAGLG